MSTYACGRAVNLQGIRLPQGVFASSRIRAVLFTLGLGPFACGMMAQQPAQRFVARRTPSGTSASAALQQARTQHLALQRQTRATPHTANLTVAWQPLGPSSIASASYGNVTGRITAIAPDPNDATGNTVYLGTTGGGVWKSTNAAGALAGVGFTPLTDTLPVFAAGGSAIASLSIGAVAVQPRANPVVLAGTGDPNDATDSLYGEGLLRSTDGGVTWTLIQNSHDGVNGNHSFSGLATAAIAFSTATPSLVVAAFSVSPQAAVVAAASSVSIPGLYYSMDAGVTWQMATVSDGITVVQQPQPLGTGQVGNAATSVVWDAFRARFFAAVRGHGYYSSTDGANWTRLTAQPGADLTPANCPVGVNGAGSSTCPIFRGVLAVQPATGDLYALTVDAGDLDQGLWQDLCNASGGACATPSPVFANRIDNGALETGSGNTAIAQGSYNLALAAAPAATNGTLLFAGTVDLYRCALAAGATSCNWRNTTNALNGCRAPAMVAPAEHALAAVPGTSLLLLGNDGGLWRSTDGAAVTGSVCSASDAMHFDNLNVAIGTGGSLTQVVGLAQHPTDPNTLLAGAGANGSAATASAAQLTAWPQLSAAEGGLPAIDPNTPNNWFVTIGAGVNLSECTLGAACTAANFVPPATVGAAQVGNDNSLLDAPTLLDPALTTSVLTATCRVWRGAANGIGWSAANALSPAFDSGSTPCTTGRALVRSLAAGGPSAAGGSVPSSGSTVLYAGIAGALDGGNAKAGHLFVTTAANKAASSTAWTDAALSPVSNDFADNYVFNPLGFDVSSIAADAHDATGATVYATVMGFGVPHLYRSTDFGAHWLNISANLPDAPANAVVIDPNDANTVYVALDTGVYVTQQIATCSTVNCWSVLGSALPNAPVVALAAGASLPTGDGRLGLLRAATYGRGIWQTPLLTAISLAQPALTLSAPGFTFAPQQVQTASAVQTLTVASSGSAALTFTTLAISGDFSETDNCAGQTLAVNAICTVQVVFAPTVTGARSGQLTLYANIAGGQATVSLSGTGTSPASITFTPPSLSFAATLVDQTTPAQTISVANSGGNTATLQAPAVTGDFSISNNTCGSTLPASTACAISIAFTPTASGKRNGTLSLTDSAGTQTAQLTGTGNAPATDTLSPLSLSFAPQQIGTASTQQVTLTNAGDVALTLISATISGDFSVVNACGNSLAPHSACAFNVSFTPTATSTRNGVLTVSDQFRSQTVSLSGIGIAPPGVSLSPASLSFAATGVGLSSVAQNLTLTNNGGLALIITNVAVSPGFSVVASTCGATLAVNTACTLAVVFAPSAAGAGSGTITLMDNAPSGTQTADLAGTGIDFTLAANGPATATLSSGSSANYSLLLSSIGSLSGNVAFSCTGAPANAKCAVNPSLGALGGTQTIAVTVQTGVTVVELTPWQRNSSYLALVLLLPLALRRRRVLHATATAMLTLGLLTLEGCGAARVIPPATGPVNAAPTTPSGTYNLTVSGTSSGITRSAGLTLIVQ